jgi:CMP-N-acetylneuraminic acid synthetase
MKIDIFLPCRSSSVRIKNKNIKKFSNIKFGLFELKLAQLMLVKGVQNIIVSTNDKKILNYLKKKITKKLIIDKRPDYLCTSKVSTDELVKYVPKVIKSDHVLWTHVTSPFFRAKDYDDAIKVYKKNIKRNDSLMGVTKIQDFIYDTKKPINFNKKKQKWPPTQSLRKLFLVNNSIFLTSKKNYINLNDRIGKNPFLLEIKKIKSFDVDWPEDFKIAENIYESIYKKKY